ncbi:hypothetical protein RYX36_026094, partial [Vicia faba]
MQRLMVLAHVKGGTLAGGRRKKIEDCYTDENNIRGGKNFVQGIHSKCCNFEKSKYMDYSWKGNL